MNFSIIKDLVSIIQALITSLALIIGGIWTYQLFVRKRQHFPRAKIEHNVNRRMVNEETTLLSIDIIISNTSEVLLSLVSGEIEVRQVLPPGTEFQQMLEEDSQLALCRRVELVDWPKLFSYTEDWPSKHVVEIEPGESEQLFYALLIPSEIKTIYVESYFRNVVKRRKELGWRAETFHDVVTTRNIATSTMLEGGF